jgi:hypothetical protein
MYGKNDLRASLAPTRAPAVHTPFMPATYGRFYQERPVDADANGQSWYCRGQNMIVNFIQANNGGRFSRSAQLDEYALLIPEAGMSVVVTAVQAGRPRDEEQVVKGPAVVFIPPGDSSILAKADGVLLRLLTTRAADLVAKCPNAGEYSRPDPNVAPFEAWPEPAGGHRIRAYPGDVPAEKGRFGRLYRGSTIMVNFGDGRKGKRDPRDVSPHHHDDFEQYSIALAGEFVHHLRWPWTSDSTMWREDEHAECASPSVAIIPPPATHTSVGMTDGLNRLCDVFCPPRLDFSQRENWVLNAADYPLPGS